MTRDQAVTDHIALRIGRSILAEYEAYITGNEDSQINGGDLVELVCRAYDDAVTRLVVEGSPAAVRIEELEDVIIELGGVGALPLGPWRDR